MTNSINANSTSTFLPAFQSAMASLLQTESDFEAGTVKSVPHSHLRGEALGKALLALAAMHGVTLQLPLHIDSRGEFSLVAMPDNGASPDYGTGHYGAFVEILNRHSPRTGIFPTSMMSPGNGWCYMNHFDAERMVKTAFASMQQPA